ncbi:hypothetical protein M9H77_35838 [Catharanthus roseus]|uniref:Uncharacterized protein n=1 Tax=Catharanthus roseus TaxID=4058 RepID=A0ACB9ZQH4_CATRO|nr:hypothetical protein M9H77_35838 [Catharanthus roseus]
MLTHQAEQVSFILYLGSKKTKDRLGLTARGWKRKDPEPSTHQDTLTSTQKDPQDPPTQTQVLASSDVPSSSSARTTQIHVSANCDAPNSFSPPTT